MKATARYQFPTKKTKTKCVTLLIANSLKVHVSVFGDASYQWISVNSCFHCGLQVQPLLMCVTLLIAINERVRDYRARPFITTANTIINGVQKQRQQLAMEQSQGWSFLYNGSGLRKYYPRNSPGKYCFFHLSLSLSISLHYIFNFFFTNSKLGAVSLLLKNLRERVPVREICNSATSEA